MPNSVKDDGKNWTIREQIIEDLVTGLTFQFEVAPNGEPRLRIFGENLPFGNREIQFAVDGTMAGSGSVTSGLSKPAWLEEIE